MDEGQRKGRRENGEEAALLTPDFPFRVLNSLPFQPVHEIAMADEELTKVSRAESILSLLLRQYLHGIFLVITKGVLRAAGQTARDGSARARGRGPDRGAEARGRQSPADRQGGGRAPAGHQYLPRRGKNVRARPQPRLVHAIRWLIV